MFLPVIGIFRDKFQIWKCAWDKATKKPPNPDIFTAILKELLSELSKNEKIPEASAN